MILDASALLAFLGDEPGADRVAEALTRSCRISAVNWAEVLARRPDPRKAFEDPSLVRLTAGDPPLLIVVPFDAAQARESARVKAATTGLPLSLADRACLALGVTQNAPVLTTDRAWRSLRLKVKVVLVR